jgi:hypothetical protein
LKDIGDL